jgi:hypothetical protein
VQHNPAIIENFFIVIVYFRNLKIGEKKNSELVESVLS